MARDLPKNTDPTVGVKRHRPGRRRRPWRRISALALVLALIATVVGVVVYQRSHAPVVSWVSGPVSAQGGRASSPDHRYNLDIAPGGVGGPVQVTFTKKTIAAQPSGLDQLIQPIGDAIAVTPDRAVTNADVVFVVSPASLPTAEPGHTRARMQNVGLEIYNESLGSWLPLEAHVDPGKAGGDRAEVRAHVLRFGVFRAVVAKLGESTVRGARNIKVNVDPATTPFQVVTAVALGAIRQFLAEPLAQLDVTKYKCGSPSRNFVFRQTVAPPGKIEACIVNASGSTELRIKSTLPVPLLFTLPKVNDVGVGFNDSSTLPDIAGQLATAQLISPVTQGPQVLLLGPGVGVVGIGKLPPKEFTAEGQLSWAASATDLTTLLLSAILPPDAVAPAPSGSPAPPPTPSAYHAVLTEARKRLKAEEATNHAVIPTPDHVRQLVQGAAAGQPPAVVAQALAALEAGGCAASAGIGLRVASWSDATAQLTGVARTCLDQTLAAGLKLPEVAPILGAMTAAVGPAQHSPELAHLQDPAVSAFITNPDAAKVTLEVTRTFPA